MIKIIKYIIKKAATSTALLFFITLILYSLIRFMPSDFVSNLTNNNPNITPQMVYDLKESYGLNDGIAKGYIKWLEKAISGDFGDSFLYKKPVTQVIGEKIGISFSLSLTAFILSIVIAVPLGVLSAVKEGKAFDRYMLLFSFISISIPSFFFASILQKILVVDLKLFPLSGMVNARADYEGFLLVLDKAYHLFLPIVLLTILSLGNLIRFTRTSMIEVLQSDYIRTARAKGIGEKSVVMKHAFRNTLIPLVTILSSSLPSLFCGAIITETFFGIDGLGQTAYASLKASDIPFIMAFNVLLSAITLLSSLICDILYAVVDPRVSVTTSEGFS